MRILILISVLALGCFPAMAQRGFGSGHFGPPLSGRFGSNHGGRHARWVGYPFGPFWGDSVYPDDLADSEYRAPLPTIVVVQQPSAATAAVPAPKPAEPLLIELRAGRYVQVSGGQVSSEQSAASPPTMYASRAHASGATAGSPILPSTLLVFRDGSRAEIRDYTIADGVLYAQTNYYTDGVWNKQIALSSLDLPATIDANRTRGVNFQLPAAPNQVIVGP